MSTSGVSRQLEMGPRWRAGRFDLVPAKWRSIGPVVSGPAARRRMAECRAADADCLDAVPFRRCEAIFRLPGHDQWDCLLSLGDQALWRGEVFSVPALLSARLCFKARGS